MAVSFIYGNKSNPGLNASLFEYVSKRIWGEVTEIGPYGTLGILNGSKLLGAVVFHNWQDEWGVIELSAAADSPRWLSRATIREIMNICFVQHKCQQLITRQAAENERAVQIYRFLGFTEILLPNMRGKGKHEILMALTDEEWASHRMNEK